MRLRVKDTLGIGLSREQIGGLFRKFEQADASTTRRYGGTGLGLAICSELIGLMGGGITVRSQLDKGALFTVTLPLSRRAEAASSAVNIAPEATPVAAELSRLRVLAAEDNEPTAGCWPP